MTRAGALPDFAGVALVDILANGLAMLIIVIVLSIAARGEHEERTATQVEQIETMMSRRVSTSLVLNSLAASPPAQLHDYRTSPLDQIHDPLQLPVLELHREFVRELHGGKIWPRRELLREPNALDQWLLGFTEQQKVRLRADVYDIAQFYLVMSILRDHDIKIYHWHFLDHRISRADAARCPPGVAAEDCEGANEVGEIAQAGDLNGKPYGDGDGNGNGNGNGDGRGDEAWPPGSSTGSEFAESAAPFPAGASLGGLGAGQAGAGQAGGGQGQAGQLGGDFRGEGMLGAESFPAARPGAGGAGELGAWGLLGAEVGAPLRFRLSTPDSQQGGLPLAGGAAAPSVDKILAVLFAYLANLQNTLDAGRSPAAQLANFQHFLRAEFARETAPPPATAAIINRLTEQLAQPTVDIENWGKPPRPLTIAHAPRAERDGAALIITPNHRLQDVAIARAAPPPAATRATFRLNAHPDVWRGLSVSLEPNAMLLMPPRPTQTAQSPAAQSPDELFTELSDELPAAQLPNTQSPNTQLPAPQLSWRALAYIAPSFDDFIIGFAYASVDTDGRLVVPAEDNRVRLDGRSARVTPARAFGARGWLVALYGALLLGVLTFVVLIRRRSGARAA